MKNQDIYERSRGQIGTFDNTTYARSVAIDKSN